MAEGHNSQPGMVGSHGQYVKGVAEVSPQPPPVFPRRCTDRSQSTIGNVTDSEAWKRSGEQDQAASIEAMRKAGENRDTSQGYGKVEEMAGKAVGCDGMRKEGADSQH